MQNSLFYQKNKNILTNERMTISKNSVSEKTEKHFSVSILFLGFLAAVMLALVLMPQAAYAKSYEMPKVTIMRPLMKMATFR